MPQARAARDPWDRRAIEQDGVSSPGQARRTVTIHGRPDGAPPARHLRAVPASRPSAALGARASRVVQIERRRPPRRTQELVSANPDRLAMWAVLMAFFLIAVAALSAHLKAPGRRALVPPALSRPLGTCV